MARFGPSGNSESYHQMGVKNTETAAAVTRKLGLDIYEYSFGHGVTMSSERARSIGEAFRREGLEISVHAPYFINFANTDPDMIVKSFGWVEKSAVKVLEMGGRRVVFHPATQGKFEREDAKRLMLDNIRRMADVMAEMPEELMLCVETMGKVVQMGTVAEVCEICNLSDRIYPCVDFGHLYARSLGELEGTAACASMLDRIEAVLGAERAGAFHSHFSKIQFTPNGGEKMHLTFAQDDFGPDPAPLMAEVARRGWSPTFICESAGTQSEDALTMKEQYLQEEKES